MIVQQDQSCKKLRGNVIIKLLNDKCAEMLIAGLADMRFRLSGGALGAMVERH
ncbi:hypothetical protein [Prosthecochloris sp.]|uniref:hypothetical protein n=1 Tax=Prosthecochloris sp. TaxID=290513 RepID=UPI0025D0DB16|nr:hypothetical protein [Prosthecochloris sp.]